MRIKALADVRSIAIDDADSIIRAFHRETKFGGKPLELELKLTEEEKKLLAKKEAELNEIPEKRELDAAVDEPVFKKARNGITG
jgi:homocitrate synthase